MDNLIAANWLHENLKREDFVLLDVSELGANDSISTIPNARFFDLKNDFVAQDSPFPNTIPPARLFEENVRKLGIDNTAKIIVFDNRGSYFSPRVWWLFKAMGHADVAVLDGGLLAWKKAGFETVSAYQTHNVSGTFKANFQPDLVKSYENIVQNTKHHNFTIVDARSKGRFDGVAEEPRKHLKSGAIPHSVNLPYESVLENEKFKSPTELRSIFESKEIVNKELVFSCGSGLTACIIMLAHAVAYGEELTLYDGSWTEWAELQGLTID